MLMMCLYLGLCGWAVLLSVAEKTARLRRRRVDGHGGRRGDNIAGWKSFRAQRGKHLGCERGVEKRVGM